MPLRFPVGGDRHVVRPPDPTGNRGRIAGHSGVSVGLFRVFSAGAASEGGSSGGVGAGLVVFAPAFFTGAFLTAAFSTGVFFAAVFLAGVFFAAVFLAGAFLAAVFLAGAFFAAVFLAGAFFAAAFLAPRGAPPRPRSATLDSASTPCTKPYDRPASSAILRMLSPAR